MSNIDAINQAPLGIKQTPRASQLIGQKSNPWFNVLATIVVIAGIIYAAIHLADDLSVVRDTRAYPYILLGVALLIALGFEFVNGFHDTANAAATVIYTNSLSPNLAVVCSGFFNFLGVLFSTGAAEMFGLPVSTTHVLSSGVAGTMVANHSGLQWATVRNLLMAWVLTVPVSIALAGSLYWLLRNLL